MKMPDDVKSELFNVLTSLPKEVDGLKRAIVDGSFDGSTYDTSNGTRGACLVGTVCKTQMRRINRVFVCNNHDYEYDRLLEKRCTEVCKDGKGTGGRGGGRRGGDRGGGAVSRRDHDHYDP